MTHGGDNLSPVMETIVPDVRRVHVAAPAATVDVDRIANGGKTESRRWGAVAGGEGELKRWLAVIAPALDLREHVDPFDLTATTYRLNVGGHIF